MQAYILSLHTPSTPGMGSNGQNIYFLKVVILHLKLKGMEHRAPYEHIFCPKVNKPECGHVAYQIKEQEV